MDLLQVWNLALAKWENSMRTTYFYNTTRINVIEIDGKASIVFPNPFKESLTIKHSSLDEHGIRYSTQPDSWLIHLKRMNRLQNLI